MNKLSAVRRARALALAAPVALVLALPEPAAAVEQKLTAADGAGRDQLGLSVAIDGDTAVVGAPAPSTFSEVGGKGAVYVFTRSGGSWTQTAKLTASDGAAGDGFGYSVAIDGDTIVAGAPFDHVAGANYLHQGSAYTFARTGAAARTETAKMTASDGADGDQLGGSVAIEGDTIVAGAHFDDIGATADHGSVYTFARTGAAARTETAKLTASDGATGDLLGGSVAVEGDAIVAGAPGHDFGANPDQGSVYTFARTGAAARSETAELTASDGDGGDQFGVSVAIEGDTIVAGAPFDNVGANVYQGSAYTFARTGTAARTETAKLTASDGAATELLGGSVAIAGDTILAGASQDDVGANADQGSASIFLASAPSPPAPIPPPVESPPCDATAAQAGKRLDGGGGRDRLSGTPKRDEIHGRAGQDRIDGGPGADCLYGDENKDHIFGGSENDVLDGGAGNDYLDGKDGNDVVSGGSGADIVIGGVGDDQMHGDGGNDFLTDGSRGHNVYDGGEGRDTIVSWQGQRDSVSCGPGVDVAYVDRYDRVSRNCETIRRLESRKGNPLKGHAVPLARAASGPAIS